MSLKELKLHTLPQDCVVLCGNNISPVKVGEYLALADMGKVQVFHGGVDVFKMG